MLFWNETIETPLFWFYADEFFLIDYSGEKRWEDCQILKEKKVSIKIKKKYKIEYIQFKVVFFIKENENQENFKFSNTVITRSVSKPKHVGSSLWLPKVAFWIQ